MRTRIALLIDGEPGITPTALSAVSFYLAGIDVEQITVISDEPETTPVVSGGTEEFSVTRAGPRSLDEVLNLSDVLVTWDAVPPSTWDGPVYEASNADTGVSEEALLRLASALAGDEHRNLAASLGAASALRSGLNDDTVAYVVISGFADLSIGSNAVLIAEAAKHEAFTAAAGAANRRVFLVSSPESFLPAPAREPAPLPTPWTDERTWIVVPDWAYRSWVLAWPECTERTIGLSIDPSLQPGSDLRSSFTVSDDVPSALLALAEFASSEIRIVATGVTPGSEMEWTQALAAIERRGGSISIIGEPSQRELSRRREMDIDIPEQLASLAPQLLVVSVNPDWVNEFGHHAHFDRALAEPVSAAGGHLVSLTSRALSPAAPSQIPTFTDPTFGFEMSTGRVFIARFIRELREALIRLAGTFPGIPIQVVMYSAGLAHQIALIDIARTINDSRISFFVNLLRAHNALLDMAAEASPSLDRLMFEVALQVGPTVGVHTMADTDEMKELVSSLTGVDLPHWPMVGVTPLDDQANLESSLNPLVVCYPATQMIKGLDTFTEVAELIAARGTSIPLRLVARDTGHQPEWVSRLANAGVDLVPGVLDPDSYASFVRGADVIVLPYHRRPFQIQTSGLLADAIRLRRPVVATRETWAGRIVDENGIGATFADSDAEECLAALEKVAAEYTSIRQQMVEFAPLWLAENNAEELLAAFRAIDTATSATIADHPGSELLSLLWRIRTALAQTTERTRTETAASSYQRIVEANARAERLNALLVRRDQTIDRLKERIDETRTDRDRRIAEFRADRDRKIAALTDRLRKRDERIERILADYERTKTNLQTRIETRERTIADLKDALHKIDSQLQTDRKRYELRIATLKDGVAKRDVELEILNRRLSVRARRLLSRLFKRNH